MKNKLKRYCIYSDSNDTIVNYLRERDIYFTAERIADLIYLIAYMSPSNIKRLKQYADRHQIGISFSRTEPFMPEFMLPVMMPYMAMTIPGRKVLRLQRSYSKRNKMHIFRFLLITNKAVGIAPRLYAIINCQFNKNMEVDKCAIQSLKLNKD